MTGFWTLLCDLFWPVDDAPAMPAPAPVPANPGDQSERALRLVRLMMAAGLAVLFALAFAQAGFAAGLQLFGVGALAALMAAALGVLTGLLFGLPTSVGRVRVVAAAGAATAPAADEANTDWYRDNTALERISEWLTTAIVTLLIANFRSIWALTGRVAIGVTEAMGLASAGTPSARAAAGGLVLGAYLLLGLLWGYLWSRRYLLKVFTDAVRDARVVQATSLKEIEALVGKGNVMSRPTSKAEPPPADPPTATPTAVKPPVAGGSVKPASTSGAESLPVQRDFPAPIAAGTIRDDPWQGRFGGQPANARARIGAEVRAHRGQSAAVPHRPADCSSDRGGTRRTGGAAVQALPPPEFSRCRADGKIRPQRYLSASPRRVRGVYHRGAVPRRHDPGARPVGIAGRTGGLPAELRCV